MSRAPELPGTFSSSLVIILIGVEDGREHFTFTKINLYFFYKKINLFLSLYILSLHIFISNILFFLVTLFTTFTVLALPVL